MLSFSTLSVLATLALSAFTSAAPTDLVSGTVSTVNGVVDSVPIVGPVVDGVLETAEGLVRRDTRNVVTIINETSYKVTEYTVQFHYITSVNATVDVLAPIVENIKVVLGDALTEINGLVGQSESVILGVEGGALLAVGEVASAIVGLLTLVLEAVSAVLSVVSSDSSECVTYLLAGLVEVLGCLVCAIVMLVTGLLSGLITLIVALLGDLTSVLVKLNVVVLVKIFGIAL